MSLFCTKAKFLKLSLQSRHKKAAELIRKCYLQKLYQDEIDQAFEAYQEVASWLFLDPLEPTLENLANRYHYHVSFSNPSLRDFLPTKQLDNPHFAKTLPIDIYLDHLRSAHNVGSILRTTEATRLGNVYLSKEMHSFNEKKIASTAMGCEKIITPSVLSDLSFLRKPLIALEITESATSLYEFTFPKSFSLLVGNEELGLSTSSLAHADYVIKIPLYGMKNSLNVSCAFAIAAYEIRRQLSGN